MKLVIVIGIALLLALAMAFSLGERSGYAQGHFDATQEVSR
jgi:hypothetical protein